MLPDPADRPCVSADEAFTELGIDRTTGYRAIKEGTFPLPVIRVGRLIRISTSALRRLLDGTSDDTDPEYDGAQRPSLRLVTDIAATRPDSDPREALDHERLGTTEV